MYSTVQYSTVQYSRSMWGTHARTLYDIRIKWSIVIGHWSRNRDNTIGSARRSRPLRRRRSRFRGFDAVNTRNGLCCVVIQCAGLSFCAIPYTVQWQYCILYRTRFGLKPHLLNPNHASNCAAIHDTVLKYCTTLFEHFFLVYLHTSVWFQNLSQSNIVVNNKREENRLSKIYTILHCIALYKN